MIKGVARINNYVGLNEFLESLLKLENIFAGNFRQKITSLFFWVFFIIIECSDLNDIKLYTRL